MKLERENEETIKKLERLLGQTLNTKENIDRMIHKCITNDSYSQKEMKEDLKTLSNNMDAIVNNIDPKFKHYLILPSTTDNDNGSLKIT